MDALYLFYSIHHSIYSGCDHNGVLDQSVTRNKDYSDSDSVLLLTNLGTESSE